MNTNVRSPLYDTATLIRVVENLKTSQTFFLDRFFPGQILSNDQYVAIDIDVGKRRMSPFVSPLVESKVVESRRIETRVFQPPYIKDKRSPDLLRPVRRMIGEQIAGNMTPQARYNANLSMEMADQIDMLKRRMEWMATQSLIYGKLIIKGEGYPEAVIDFNRSADLTEILSGTDCWDDPATKADPTADIRRWAKIMLKESGAQMTDLIFTNSAYNALMKFDSIKTALLNSALRSNQDADLTLGPNVYPGASYQGHWGQFNIWLYNDWYVDENNVEQPMIPDGTVIGVSDRLDGTRAYGAIFDPEIGYMPVPFAPKMWSQSDPSQLFLMTQSAPLVIPTRINASFCATVSKGEN